MSSYCMLGVDTLERICRFVYYGTEKVDERSLIKFVGIHHSYANNILDVLSADECDSGIIGYLSGSREIIGHDRFPELQRRIDSELLESTDHVIADLFDTLDEGVRTGQDEEWVSDRISQAIGKAGASIPATTAKVRQREREQNSLCYISCET